MTICLFVCDWEEIDEDPYKVTDYTATALEVQPLANQLSGQTCYLIG